MAKSKFLFGALAITALNLVTSSAWARVTPGQCIPNNGSYLEKCSNEELSQHISEEFARETKGVVTSLNHVCANPLTNKLTKMNFLEIQFDDGLSQLIYPLHLERYSTCLAIGCPPAKSRVHFLAMENGKITYQSRELSLSGKKGPQWSSKGGKQYGFETYQSPDAQRFFGQSDVYDPPNTTKLSDSAQKNFCAAFREAQSNDDFANATQMENPQEPITTRGINKKGSGKR